MPVLSEAALLGSRLAHKFQCFLHLRVFARQQLFRGQCNRDIRRHSLAFDQPSFPCQIGSNWKSHDVAKARLKRTAAQKPPWRFRANNSCKLILLCERSNHFTRARRVLVHEDYDTTVEFLWTEAFRYHENRFVNKPVPQSQPKKCRFVGRYPTEPWQLFSSISLFLASARQTVSHLFLIG